MLKKLLSISLLSLVVSSPALASSNTSFDLKEGDINPVTLNKLLSDLENRTNFYSAMQCEQGDSLCYCNTAVPAIDNAFKRQRISMDKTIRSLYNGAANFSELMQTEKGQAILMARGEAYDGFNEIFYHVLACGKMMDNEWLIDNKFVSQETLDSIN